jgi:hypothetical protein
VNVRRWFALAALLILLVASQAPFVAADESEDPPSAPLAATPAAVADDSDDSTTQAALPTPGRQPDDDQNDQAGPAAATPAATGADDGDPDQPTPTPTRTEGHGKPAAARTPEPTRSADTTPSPTRAPTSTRSAEPTPTAEPAPRGPAVATQKAPLDRNSINGTVVGLDSTSSPAIIILATDDGEITVSLLDSRLLPLIQLGQPLTLYGRSVSPTEFEAAGYGSQPLAEVTRTPEPRSATNPASRSLPDGNTITGLVMGLDSTVEPPIIVLSTEDGIVTVSLLDDRLLPLVQLAQPLTLTGNSTGPGTFAATGYAGLPLATATPERLAAVRAPTARPVATVAASRGTRDSRAPDTRAPDLSGLIVGLDTFSSPAQFHLRDGYDNLWLVTVRNNDLLPALPMGRFVNLVGRKTSPTDFDLLDVLPS